MQQHDDRHQRGLARTGLGIGVVATGCLIATGAFRLANSPAAVATATPHVERERTFTDRDDARPITAPDERTGFTFAVFGDRTGGPAEGIRVLEQAVADVELHDPDLVMTVGDLIEGYDVVAPWMAQMREFRSVMDRLSMPWYPVAGNHDVYWRGPDRPPEEHERRYEEHFGPLWYAFDHRDCAFIVLYSDEPNPETGERNFNKPECQRMSDEQKRFLARALQRGASARHAFVFIHHPRWRGGQYGDDWEGVHAMLAAAGNVRAVFAGHDHVMRHDGRRDGIEYVTLATVGGHQNGHAPDAGWLHQFHLVTVRDDGIEMAALPVGATLDPRAITASVNDAARRLARLDPAFDAPIELASDGAADDRVLVTFTNPTDHVVTFDARPRSDDSRWRVDPPHDRTRLAPGATGVLRFAIARPASPLDGTVRLPELSVDATIETAGRAIAVPTRTAIVPVAPSIDVDGLGGTGRDGRLALDGRDDAALVESERLDLPDGPFTLEARFTGADFRGRRGLCTKTENSEFGLFVSDGRANFCVHLDGAYAEAETTESVLRPGVEHHLAGVFDGDELRLYLDGRLVARAPASGRRTRNALPFVIGADVDGAGRPMSRLPGLVDEVRISTGARYAGDAIDPADDPAIDDDADETTVLWIRAAGDFGPFLADFSGRGAHARIEGGATVAPKVD